MELTARGRPEHLPLGKPVDLTATMGMAIIREPKSRVISALLDGVHLEGFVNRTLGHELRATLLAMDADKGTPHQEKLMKKAMKYAYHPMLYGHQVKMLLGEMDLNLSVKTAELYPSVVERAVERLRRFFFVGVFEEYARSLRLFHALADVGTEPTAVELFPQRTTYGADSAYLKANFPYEDPYDTLLHQRAQQIFREEIAYVKRWKGLGI